jgi:hypothetical protein
MFQFFHRSNLQKTILPRVGNTDRNLQAVRYVGQLFTGLQQWTSRTLDWWGGGGGVGGKIKAVMKKLKTKNKKTLK